MKNITRFIILLSLFTLSCSKSAKDSAVDDPQAFREYILFTSDSPHSTATPIGIQLAQSVEHYQPEEELPSDWIKISPRTKGKLILDTQRKLLFIPDQKLKPDTKYKVQLKLDELFESIKPDLKTFTFSFKTLAPNFKIDLGNLQSYTKAHQYLEGVLESADAIDSDQLPTLLHAFQNDKELSIKWKNPERETTYFQFRIDSIVRLDDDQPITLKWNGKSIGSSQKGEEEILIPGRDNFNIIDLETQNAPKASLVINFSDPLDEQQDFSGLVQIEKVEDSHYEVEGNVLYVYPTARVNGNLNVKVSSGIKNKEGKKLKEDFTDNITFEQLKPQVELISKGVILPNSSSTPLYFKAVNLKAVDIRVIKIYENNILGFLQDNDLNNASSYNIRKYGRRIAKKTVSLEVNEEDQGTWKAHAIQLSELFKADPGALYQVELSFRRSYALYDCDSSTEKIDSDLDKEKLLENTITDEEEVREEQYWNNEAYTWRDQIYDWEHRDNPCYDVYYQPEHFVTTNLLGSNLSIIAKKGSDNSYQIFATDIPSARAKAGVDIELFDYQKQSITKLKTDNDGKASYEGDREASFAIGHKGEDYAYIDLSAGNSLSLSKFDVSGTQLQKGLKGFIYTERGVYRPGDDIHLTFVLDDTENPLPDDIPIKLEVENARGKLIQREVLISGQEKKESKALNHFYYFKIPTKATDETGNWHAKVSAGGVDFTKTLPVAAIKPNRLKINITFDNKVLQTSKPLKGILSGSWLHGAPARNLKAEMEVNLTPTNEAFKAFKGYTFTDPVREFDKTEMQVVKTTLSAEGKATFEKSLDIDKKAPGMLKATFLTKIFEEGGDFSLDVYSKNLAPYDYFVGLKSPETQEYDAFYTDESQRFEVVSVNPEGEISGNRKLKIQVFKIEWKWWWYSGEDRLSKYEDASIHKPVENYELTTDANGKANFHLNIPDKERGRYLIRVIDQKSGHATGRTAYFFKNWFSDPNESNAEDAEMLVFSADKDTYTVGETAHIKFPSGRNGRALISVESGTKVLSSQWVSTEKGETKVDIPLTKAMAPNVFINISLIQPHDQVKNDLPIRLYGVIPLEVENKNTILKPQIEMPNELRPEAEYTVKVSEQNNKPMTYTLAVVDEGLLDLTRFSTPTIHSSFYAHQALGVKTFDLYDYVIGAFSGSVSNIYEIGGDDAATQGKKNKANRFKPVVKYLGPFYLKAGQQQSHQIKMPNYIGSVRTMLIAGDTKTAAYGSVDKTTPVKKPLMVLASLPRKLSPGETISIPVTVFAMKENIKDVQVAVKTGNGLTPITGDHQVLHFDQPDDKIANFSYKINPTDDVQKIVIEVSGHGEKASYEVEVDVENPNPITHKLSTYEFGENDEKEISYQAYGEPDTRKVQVEFSTLPPMNYTKRMQYLVNYPHFCIEQSTSAGFSQLYYDELFDIDYTSKKEAEENIKSVIERIGDAQLTNGGVPFWPGQSKADQWATTFSGHFMLEAKEKGYALPLGFLNNWIIYQKNQAKHWSPRDYAYNSSLEQSYRLYSLALAGHAELSAMNRLRESGALNNQAKWRLAAAYSLAGKKEAAQELAKSATLSFKSHQYDYYSYGSTFRNKAMALETMVLLEDPNQQELARSIAKTLTSDQWLSTQETSYALLALTKMIRKNGGKTLDIVYTEKGKSETIQTKKGVAIRKLSSGDKGKIHIKNNKKNKVFISLYQEGKLPLGEEVAQHKNLSLSTNFLDKEGKTIDINTLHQGTEVEAQISISNTSNNFINDVALTQVFPGGWEIINTSYTELGGGASGDADFMDLRDDRVNFYFDLDKGETKIFKVKLNASYLGQYYLPGTYAEGMYDHSYYVQTKGKWIEVKE